MTLIAAWLTPEFRIVASDSRLTNNFGMSIHEDYQKVFSNNQISIGLYGSLPITDRKTFIQFLKVNPEIEKDIFYEELIKMFASKKRGNKDLNLKSVDVSHFLVVPKNEEPEIFCLQFDARPLRLKLSDYKKEYQKALPGEIFFSEQFNNESIDIEHQEALLEHFEFLRKESKTEKIQIYDCDAPDEVKILMKLNIDSINPEKTKISRKNIGGLKTYCAYSYKGNNWQQIKYPEKEFFSMEKLMQQINEKLELESKESHLPPNMRS